MFNNNRDKLHNKCNALESSTPPGLWKNVFHETPKLTMKPLMEKVPKGHEKRQSLRKD